MTADKGRVPATSDTPEDLDDDEGPRPRLSFLRVSLAFLLLTGGLGAAGIAAKRTMTSAAGGTLNKTWFAPYVDTTLTPTTNFQDPAADPARQAVLGFVVAAGAGTCSPSWGAYYSLPAAANALNLDRRIAQLRRDGSDAIVSFGGKANTDLAVACTSTAKLQAAYRAVISRYRLTTVDFDIEGAALDNWPSIQRRATAVARIQKSIRAGGHQLAVWVTLPVEPNGLQANAVSVVTAMLRAGVDLAGVNAMTMDFATPQPDMLAAVEQSLTATVSQLRHLYSSYGVHLSAASAWNKTGATVMIGQADQPGQQFTVSDAGGLVRFATATHLGRVSMWSLNRDAQCGTSFAEIGVHANTCSGVAQHALQFSRVFDRLTGTAAAVAGSTTSTVAPPVTSDNPAASPYPIWQPTAGYVAGYKVVRLGYVYQAKWYTKGDDPSAQTQYSWQTPWLLIGPVLPGEHPPTTTTLPPTTYPRWSPTSVYHAGAKVLLSGLPYQAKWYNQGASPAAATVDPTSSPWKPLYTVPGEPSVSPAG